MLNHNENLLISPPFSRQRMMRNELKKNEKRKMRKHDLATTINEWPIGDCSKLKQEVSSFNPLLSN